VKQGAEGFGKKERLTGGEGKEAVTYSTTACKEAKKPQIFGLGRVSNVVGLKRREKIHTVKGKRSKVHKGRGAKVCATKL